ncbi:MAG: DNA alkylation repair protein [Elusimicrobiota bacterium]|jgi:3-methyladenine DNA glycosylase AlkD|nr:DNA alkylation repair protein [Elusimicrobiota bacterium]
MAKKYKKLFLDEIKSNKNAVLAKHLSMFFKTKKGEYGYGDKFWGLNIPLQRKIAKKYFLNLTLKDIEETLRSPIHEIRFSSLLVLIEKYKIAANSEKKSIADLYLSNTKYINNWDLVDLSAPAIAGDFWFNSSLEKMFDLAYSNDLWKERIAIISTFYFIKRDRFDETLKLCEYFLEHNHDLIHKAAGWMLREIGKRNKEILYCFLDKFHKKMPRTMLRYSIEKLSDKERKQYMKK